MDILRSRIEYAGNNSNKLENLVNAIFLFRIVVASKKSITKSLFERFHKLLVGFRDTRIFHDSPCILKT